MTHVTLTCPACHEDTLACSVAGVGRDLTVILDGQTCDCDPFDAWEDVWEQAREVVYEESQYD